MNEDFVTYDIAVKLKEKGYPQNGFHYYNENGYIDVPIYNLLDEDMSDTIAPTISQVLKWLREEKKAHVIVDICKRGWFFNIRCLRTGYVMDGTSLGYSYSFEQASLAAIEFALDNIIKEEES